MKKRMITLAMALCISATMVVPASAATADVQEAHKAEMNVSIQQVTKSFESRTTKEIGTASIKDAVVVNGVTNYLYPTFDNMETSLNKLKTMIPEYYSLVNEKVDLEKAYDFSYSDFAMVDFDVDIAQVVVDQKDNTVQLRTEKTDAAVSALPIDVEEKLDAQEETFDHFFDIYENKAKNEEIMNYLATTPDPDPETLAYMLPYNSAFAREYFANTTPALAAGGQIFSEPNGTAYAKRFATGRSGNYPDYTLLGGDCTNFASQILVAGGINMHDNYPDEKAGWWCRKVTIGTVNPAPAFKSSATWRVADSFVRFMGTWGTEYTSFYTFASKIKRGDFIAYDGDKDGDWDHIGYVTGVGSLGTYNGKIYKDFCVAQHSKDYNAWVSSSTNSWETLDGGAKFAIVRRNAVA